MRRDSEARNCFFVADGEVITVIFEAANVPDTPVGDRERVHAAENGNVLQKTVSSADRTVTFRFTASQPVGKSHLVIYECVFFTTTDPKGAKYKIQVAGRAGSQQSGPFATASATQLGRSGELWFTVE